MPRYILKLHDNQKDKDYYFFWSSVVDAPVSEGLSKEEFTKVYQMEFGLDGMRGFPERMERVEDHGSSCALGQTADDMISGNRAGDNENELTKEEILNKYCHF